MAVKASRRYQIVHVGAKGWEKDSYLFFAAAKICCGMTVINCPRVYLGVGDERREKGRKKYVTRDTNTYSKYPNEEDATKDHLLFQ